MLVNAVKLIHLHSKIDLEMLMYCFLGRCSWIQSLVYLNQVSKQKIHLCLMVWRFFQTQIKLCFKSEIGQAYPGFLNIGDTEVTFSML